MRQLGLVFGSTTLAMATVLAVFMGGLGLGSFLVSRLEQRIERLRLAYAIVEIGVGLYALGVPLLLDHYPALARLLHHWLGGSPWGLALGRFVASALLLAIPTTGMGATLPLLAGYLLKHGGRRVSSTVGALYSTNTVGAVAGTVLAGFHLLPELGVRTTTLVAALTDIGLGLLIVFIRPPRPVDDELLLVDLDEQPPAPPPPAPVRSLVRASFLLSGAAAMIIQVLWNRALAIVLGSSVYSFALILVAFLVGLALGSALIGRISRRTERPLLWLAGTHVAVFALMLGSIAILDKLPRVFIELLRGDHFDTDSLLRAQFTLCLLAILPVTVAMGGVFPTTLALVVTDPEHAAAEVGRAYAWNTAGAILGSFLAGFVVMPMIGVENGLKLAASASLFLGALLCAVAERRRLAAVVGVVGAVAILVLPPWQREIMSAGLFRVAIARDILHAKRWRTPDLLYYKDGISTTVSVEKWGKTIALKNNGKVDASNGDDMATQILVGLLPLVFYDLDHPSPAAPPPRAALVGYGSGVTAGAMLQYPLASVDVVELEPEVVAAGSKYFIDFNHNPPADPRFHPHINDGRNFLDVTDTLYDVIVSEPSNPWLTGVSNLFTVEYWRMAKARLKPDGVFCQWAQLYELRAPNVKSLLRSFVEVFPNAYVFAAEDLSSDVLLVASPRPLPLDLGKLERVFSLPTVKAELARAGVRSGYDLVASLLLTPEEIPALTAGAVVNTDDNAHIEFAAPRDLLGSLTPDPLPIRVYSEGWPYGRIEPYLTGLGEGETAARHWAELAERALRHGHRTTAARFLTHAKQHLPGAATARTAILLDRLGERDTAQFEEPLTSEASSTDHLGLGGLEPPRLDGASADDAQRRAADYLKMEQATRLTAWATALKAIATWSEEQVKKAGPDFHLLLGMLLYKVDLYTDAVERLEPLTDDADFAKRRPALYYYLGRSLYGAGRYTQGVDMMGKYLDREK